MEMDSLSLGRWRFAITTVYHFLFVPLTIGLAFLVAPEKLSGGCGIHIPRCAVQCRHTFQMWNSAAALK